MNKKNELLFNSIAFITQNTYECYFPKLLNLLKTFNQLHQEDHGYELGFSLTDKDVDDLINNSSKFFEIFNVLTPLGREEYIMVPKFSVDEDVFSPNQHSLLMSICENDRNANVNEIIPDVNREAIRLDEFIPKDCTCLTHQEAEPLKFSFDDSKNYSIIIPDRVVVVSNSFLMSFFKKELLILGPFEFSRRFSIVDESGKPFFKIQDRIESAYMKIIVS